MYYFSSLYKWEMKAQSSELVQGHKARKWCACDLIPSLLHLRICVLALLPFHQFACINGPHGLLLRKQSIRYVIISTLLFLLTILSCFYILNPWFLCSFIMLCCCDIFLFLLFYFPSLSQFLKQHKNCFQLKVLIGA